MEYTNIRQVDQEDVDKGLDPAGGKWLLLLLMKVVFQPLMSLMPQACVRGDGAIDGEPSK